MKKYSTDLNDLQWQIIEKIQNDQRVRKHTLIKQFKQLDKMPEDEKKSILKVLNALIRDFNARQAYVL
jgi:hypothetical protein